MGSVQYVLSLLLTGLVATTGAQMSSVPRGARELAVWLEQDPSGPRTWRALVTLGASSNVGVKNVLREHLLRRVSPAGLEKELARSPALVSPVLALLSDALMREPVADYVVALARSTSNRMGNRGGPWSNEELRLILTIQFVDPERFQSDARFRARVIELLPRAIGERAPRPLRDQLLFSINNVPGIDFEASEAIEWGWSAIERLSAPRQTLYDSQPLHFHESTLDPIIASIYSLPSTFLESREAVAFLTRIRELAPSRELIVLIDLPLRVELEETARHLNVHLAETHGRRYSAWPRDPFSLVRDEKGNVVVLVRPNFQRGRFEDSFLGRELVQGLPEALDRAWGKVRWTRSPVPFHNGQVLFTEGQAWISLHSLEPHVLGILDLERVPVDEFDTSEGWLRYVRAAQHAVGTLSTFYGRRIVFVHELVDQAESNGLSARVEAIGGGAGFDLDSLVTMVEADDGRIHALVGDVDEGRRVLSKTSHKELEVFRGIFGLDPEGEALRRVLTTAQLTQRAQGLDGFLELVSRSLTVRGVAVHRLPLFFVPVAILENRGEFHHEDFLITWNNVVLERREGSLHAEGFSQGLTTGDARAHDTFRAVGYELDLIPPLVRSIVLVGGYRCASQHLR